MPSHTHTSPLTVGIDLGGTHAQVGLVDGDANIIARASIMTDAHLGHESVIERLASTTREVCNDAGISLGDLHGLGIGAPGVIDLPTGTVIDAPNMKWKNIPLASALSERLDGVRTVVDNDVNAATLGECALGAGKGAQNCLGVWVGTGVGGGIIRDGALLHGVFGSGGEIGQTVLFPDEPPETRLLEHHTSRSFITRRISQRIESGESSSIDTSDRITAKDLARAFESGDRVAREEIERGARLLGIGIANALSLFALPLVILGGGLTEELGEPYAKLVSDSIEQHLFPKEGRLRIEVRVTALRENAGLLGGALLAR